MGRLKLPSFGPRLTMEQIREHYPKLEQLDVPANILEELVDSLDEVDKDIVDYLTKVIKLNTENDVLKKLGCKKFYAFVLEGAPSKLRIVEMMFLRTADDVYGFTGKFQ